MYAGEYGNHAFTIVLIWSKAIRVWPNHDVILLCIGTQKSSGSSYQHHRIHRNQSWKNNDEVYVLRPGSVQLVRRGGVHRRWERNQVQWGRCHTFWKRIWQVWTVVFFSPFLFWAARHCWMILIDFHRVHCVHHPLAAFWVVLSFFQSHCVVCHFLAGNFFWNLAFGHFLRVVVNVFWHRLMNFVSIWGGSWNH